MGPQTIIETPHVPIKIWSNDVEPEAIKQLENTARLPFVFKHVAAMPDVHFGRGATIGSVIATKGAICPAAVGVDIGCGMMAVKLDLSASNKAVLHAKLAEIRHSIERSIPVGFNKNKLIPDEIIKWFDNADQRLPEWLGPNDRLNATLQLGSLGGGNHFIEVCLDTEGNVWVMLHSGSRNIGKVLAEKHIDKAKGLMKQMFIGLPDPDLAYFAEGTPEFIAYVNDVRWAQKYAMMNRQEMMRRILKDLGHALNDGVPLVPTLSVNCHHNYLELEHHYGENVIVTRKGAVRARVGDMGIIPGSMGTRSYIVEGKGNPESFNSCSHGAGRRMSRTRARATFTVEDLAKQTAGVECRKDSDVIDEIPGAYKDIDVVMANQSDLVKVVAELKQILCVKG
jgi:tRNA-splicing ligase RtcB (3'-phosphate/5'-hydroxy nucleic acid ligase)